MYSDIPPLPHISVHAMMINEATSTLPSVSFSYTEGETHVLDSGQCNAECI
jgi:hypothetical protein